MPEPEPLVSIITPVYNGGAYLKECIESILAQTYQHWEYTIINNCSTDGTLEIARQYADRDNRIRIHNNEVFVDVIRNHNISFQKISPDSKYCKIAQADDFLFPECLSSMVSLAEAYPSAGVIGAYSLAGAKVRCDGIPYPSPLISGQELCRLTLLGKLYLFLSPSSLLIKSEQIRDRSPYYGEGYLNADVDALYKDLEHCDFGFVHQVLTYIRRNPESMTAQDRRKANMQLLSNIQLLLKHGPTYLTEAEQQKRLSDLWQIYYQSLAQSLLKLQGQESLQHQTLELDKMGYSLHWRKLINAALSQIIFSPRRTARGLKMALLSKKP